MSNFASLLKAEISRIAGKALRAEIETLRKASAEQRSHIAALRRDIQHLERVVRRIRLTSTQPSTVRIEDAPINDEPQRRFIPKRLASHRTKLGLSAASYGQLVGVAGQTIYN